MIAASDDRAAFPSLTIAELEKLERRASVRHYQDGDLLFSAGDRNFDFFVVKAGAVEIIERSSGTPRSVTVHREREFVGDVDLLTGHPAVASAIARDGCEVYEVPRAELRRVLAEIPGLSEKLLEAFQRRRDLLERSGFQGLRVIGLARTDATLLVREFLFKNAFPYTFYDSNSEEGHRLLEELGQLHSDLPVVACERQVMSRPDLRQLSEALGLKHQVDGKEYDLTILGAGPAGLAAAVYAASEGLRTLLVDSIGPGGQVGGSSRIENYMGFPSGVSGADLASRAMLQALKFGAEFTAPLTATRLEQDGDAHLLSLDDGQVVRSRIILLTTGVSYRPLPAEGCDRLLGSGVYHAATSVEARSCAGGTAVVVGGGNSAGQAAMFLSEHAYAVKLIIRSDSLDEDMSQYLARRIKSTEKVEVLRTTEVQRTEGSDCLERVTLKNMQTGHETNLSCAALFVFIGSEPRTKWLPDSIALDDKGFVLTGSAAGRHSLWPLEREPCGLETTMPGVLAGGDVRSGSTKRVAFAAGDGALAVTCAHSLLAQG